MRNLSIHKEKKGFRLFFIDENDESICKTITELDAAMAQQVCQVLGITYVKLSNSKKDIKEKVGHFSYTFEKDADNNNVLVHHVSDVVDNLNQQLQNMNIAPNLPVLRAWKTIPATMKNLEVKEWIIYQSHNDSHGRLAYVKEIVSRDRVTCTIKFCYGSVAVKENARLGNMKQFHPKLTFNDFDEDCVLSSRLNPGTRAFLCGRELYGIVGAVRGGNSIIFEGDASNYCYGRKFVVHENLALCDDKPNHIFPEICRHCKCTLEISESASCCSETFCDRCAREIFVVCSRCNSTLCPPHVKNCSGCEDTYCDNCVRECRTNREGHCSAEVCRKCKYCKECFNDRYEKDEYGDWVRRYPDPPPDECEHGHQRCDYEASNETCGECNFPEY